jgi:glycosyltransferase involved in cell wall biosynthesis
MVTTPRPRISILIPVWNGGRWLRGAVDSVLAQNNDAWELVIGDNASTDETPKLAQSIDDPRVRSVRWEEHTDAFTNFNRGWTECAADWSYILPADDRLRPGFVSRVLEEIDADQSTRGLAMVTTAFAPLDPDGRPIDGTYFGHQGRRPVRTGIYDAAGWLNACAAPGAAPWTSGVYRRSAIEQLGAFYRTDVPNMSADLELALRIATVGDVAYVDERLVEVISWDASHTQGRVIDNIVSRERFTPQGRALQEGLLAHEARRSVSADECSRVHAAIARSHLRRATSQRTLAGGLGRRGALMDVRLAARANFGATARQWVKVLAVLIAPVSFLRSSRFRSIDRKNQRASAQYQSPHPRA